MSVQIEMLEHNMAKLTITVDAATFDKNITEAYKKMKNQISVPGFRKGKVPQKMVEKMYGPGIFYEEAANMTIPDAYDAAMAEITDIIITSQPDIDVVQIEKGQDFIFTAEVAVKPEASLGQYKGIEVTKEDVTVTDDEVAAELASAQEKNSRVITVDGPASIGDTVVLDFAGTVDGVAFDGGTAEGYELELGSGSFIPGFEDQLVGIAAEGEVNVNVTFPDDYAQTDLAGKAAVFACKIHEVKRKELPELDDDFAQDVSEFDTLEEYKEDVKKNLAAKKEEAAANAVKQAVVDKIIENAQIDIPQPMIDTQAKQMVDRYAMDIQRAGLTMEMYMQYTGMRIDDLVAQMKPQALKNIQSRLVLEAVAKAEAMEVSEEELEAEFARMSEQYGMEVEKIKEMMGEVDIESIKSDLLANRALEFVAAQAVLVPAEQ